MCSSCPSRVLSLGQNVDSAEVNWMFILGELKWKMGNGVRLLPSCFGEMFDACAVRINPCKRLYTWWYEGVKVPTISWNV